MKKARISNIFNITLLTILLVFGMTLCVMANDNDAENLDPAEVAEEIDNNEDVTPEDTEETPEVTPGDTEDQDEDFIEEDNDDEEEPEVDEPKAGEGTEVVEPETEAEDEGELGDAAYSDPNTGKTKVHHPNGETEEFVNPPEDDFEGVLGPASSSDPSGRTQVWFPDGHVEVYPPDVKEPTYTSSISWEPYDNDSDYAAAASVSDISSDKPEELAEEVVVTEEVVEPLSVEEAVLGDYDAPEQKRIPFAAGFTFFSSTVIGLGVLWKLGIIAL